MRADMTTGEKATGRTLGAQATPPYACDGSEVAALLASDPASGLTSAEAASRRSRYGANEITSEPTPSV